MQEWRLIVDDPRNGELNMAVDRAILAACEAGQVPPTLRLYSWKRPTMTIGYAQKLREIDVDRCKKLGIQIVRRPTGGRALFHNHEVTYSFTAPIPHPEFPSSLFGAYEVVAGALLEGLKELGVSDAVLSSGRKTNKDQGFFHSASCLSSICHFEIEAQGAKLIGSAQRRTKKAFLQHGSILLDCDRTLLGSLFKYETDDLRCRAMEILNSKVITLSECLGKNMTHDDIFCSLKNGFARALLGKWRQEHLNSFELAQCFSNSNSG